MTPFGSRYQVGFSDEVIEIRSVDGQVRVARKARYYDEWDPPIAPYERRVDVLELLRIVEALRADARSVFMDIVQQRGRSRRA